MGWQEHITGKIKGAGDWAGRFISNGGHAQQDIPAQHRLLAAGGMLLGWVALDKLRDVIFGFNQVSEGDFEEIKREHVPAPLRFLHKTIDWNPHSEKPEDQWKKLAHQMLPAIGAGVGTVAGSMYAFERNKRAHKFVELKNSKNPLLLPDADMAAQYAQSRTLRILTAATGGFSAASMLPLVYGAMLNLSFASANGARIFTGDLAMGNAAPTRAVETHLGGLSNFLKNSITKEGKISDKWAEGMVNKVLTPLFAKDLKSPQAQEEMREKIQQILQKSFDGHNAEGITKDKVIEAVAADMKKAFGNSKEGIDKTITELGLDKKDATLGNAIPIVRDFTDFLAKIGIGKDRSSQSFVEKMQYQKAAAAANSLHTGQMSPAGV